MKRMFEYILYCKLDYPYSKTILSQPCMKHLTRMFEYILYRVLNCYPGGKSVYIAPLKALVRERIEDWKIRFEQKLHCKVVELTGDTSPDIRAIEKADVIVTTPEKWDGISRSWQNRLVHQPQNV